MDFKKHYATDSDAEAEGQWIEWSEGTRLKIARLGNPNYNRLLQAKMKPVRHLRDRGTLPDAESSRILCEVIAETIITDWEGVEYEGKELSYSRENALMLLTELKDFREDVITVATEQSVFRSEEIADSAKNSSRSSSGKRTGGHTSKD
tara:strand:- start:1973 stop:2419 length:447 start_codon:yes stop_codon:yes gene_type:complete